MKKSVETFLPLFSGFYNSIWDTFIEDELEYLQEEEELDYSIDYEGYSKDITKCIDFTLSGLDLDINIEFQKLVSPKFYNYSTDAIYVKLELDFDKFISKVADNYDAIKKLIAERYSSYDGFSSSHSNEYEDWFNDLLNDFENQQHKVGAMLDMLCEVEEIEEIEALEEFMANYSVSEFIKF